MKYRSNGNYFIPDLVGDESKRVDEYCFTEDNVMLGDILQQTSDGLIELFQQYPMALDMEFIMGLVDRAYKTAKTLKVNPELCYHYFAKKNGIYRGISIDFIDEEQDMGLFLMKMTASCGRGNQTRVNFMYDIVDDCLIPKEVLEVEARNGIAVQKSFSPKILRKTKKYIRY